jgi:hypothetical protein
MNETLVTQEPSPSLRDRLLDRCNVEGALGAVGIALFLAGSGLHNGGAETAGAVTYGTSLLSHLSHSFRELTFRPD